MWGKYENDTLIHQHIMAKSYKKRYQRASDLNNTFYRIFGLVTVITSSVASTITWGSDIEEAQKETIKYITTISAISAAILNFYNFKDLSKEYTNTAKQYALLQNTMRFFKIK
jgi:cytochrome c biogenesis protein CcdA